MDNRITKQSEIRAMANWSHSPNFGKRSRKDGWIFAIIILAWATLVTTIIAFMGGIRL